MALSSPAANAVHDASRSPPYPAAMTELIDSLDLAVDRLLTRIPGPLHVGAPLGIGKPHRLLNALYARIERDPSRPLHLYTALSLDPPGGGSELERRFLGPFVVAPLRRPTSRAWPTCRRRSAMRCRRTSRSRSSTCSPARCCSSRAGAAPLRQPQLHPRRARAGRPRRQLHRAEGGDATPTARACRCRRNTDLTFDAIDAIARRAACRDRC